MCLLLMWNVLSNLKLYIHSYNYYLMIVLRAKKKLSAFDTLSLKLWP